MLVKNGVNLKQVGMKLNVDRNYWANLESCGRGGLILDDTEKVHGVFSILFGHSMNNEAQLQTLKEGVGLCKELSFSQIIIEYDLLLIVN